MEVYQSFSSFKSKKQTVVTIGMFDGVHLGHQKILSKVTANAQEMDCESVVLTFFPHPKMVVHQNTNVQLLNTISERIHLIEKTQIDHLIIQKFDLEFSNLSALDFVQNILVKHLNVKKIIIGYDHRFGKNRAANVDDLIAFGRTLNFEVEQISVQEIQDVAISSTKIRQAIMDGNISLANHYLGYPYQLQGTVIKGNQKGRTIGFPTANVQVAENYKMIPKNGVYIAHARIHHKMYNGVMNIGTRPTINGVDLAIEIHLFDFDSDVYNQEIEVYLLQNLRDEIKFDHFELLKNQIALDKQLAIDYFDKKASKNSIEHHLEN